MLIEKLTEEQTAAIPGHRDMWIDIGLSTERVDFEAAKNAIGLVYTSYGYEPPSQVYMTNGPIEMRDKFRELFPEASFNDFTSNIIYGNHEAGWLSFIDFFASKCNMEGLEKAHGLIQLAKVSSWVWVEKDVAIICDRPSVIKRDDNNLLHAEDCAAILYRDGFAVYAWHGQQVPKKWIMEKQSLTAAEALGQTNMELRRAACEIVGWANILNELNYKTIHEDEDPMIGKLVEVNIPDIGKEKFLMVRCGTGRDFAIPVPPDMKTALEANCWTYGFENNELQELEVRT